MKIIHVVPLNDWFEHNEDGTECHCGPRIIVENGVSIVIHNAYDDREEYERNLEFARKRIEYAKRQLRLNI